MTTDSALNVLGLAISIGGLVAAGLKREVVFAIVASALAITTGVAAWRTYAHEREIARVQSQIMGKLSQNRWTFDRIYSEVHYVPYQIVHEALFRAVEHGTVQGEPTDCIVSGGAVLSTRVYYAESP